MLHLRGEPRTELQHQRPTKLKTNTKLFWSSLWSITCPKIIRQAKNSLRQTHFEWTQTKIFGQRKHHMWEVTRLSVIYLWMPSSNDCQRCFRWIKGPTMQPAFTTQLPASTISHVCCPLSFFCQSNQCKTTSITHTASNESAATGAECMEKGG